MRPHGIRVRHPIATGCTLIVHHPRKDIAVHLDGTGHALISTGVWAQVQQADHRFVYVNDVYDPPTQNVGIGGGGLFQRQPVVEDFAEALRTIAPPGVAVRMHQLRITKEQPDG